MLIFLTVLQRIAHMPDVPWQQGLINIFSDRGRSLGNDKHDTECSLCILC